MIDIVQDRKRFLMVWWMVGMGCIWNKDLHHFFEFEESCFLVVTDHIMLVCLVFTCLGIKRTRADGCAVHFRGKRSVYDNVIFF